MVTFSLSKRSRERLKGVHPALVRVVEAAIEISPVDFRVEEGVRDRQRQAALLASGASHTMDSRHLVQADGWGWAVDLVAVGDLDGDGVVDTQDWRRTWDRQWYQQIAEAMAAAATRLGVPIRWGGTFKTRGGREFFDGPHFELAPGAAELLALGSPLPDREPEPSGSVRA